MFHIGPGDRSGTSPSDDVIAAFDCKTWMTDPFSAEAQACAADTKVLPPPRCKPTDNVPPQVNLFFCQVLVVHGNRNGMEQGPKRGQGTGGEGGVYSLGEGGGTMSCMAIVV